MPREKTLVHTPLPFLQTQEARVEFGAVPQGERKSLKELRAEKHRAWRGSQESKWEQPLYALLSDGICGGQKLAAPLHAN
jgi:hypothetical protein